MCPKLCDNHTLSCSIKNACKNHMYFRHMLLCEFNKMGWIGGNWKKTLSTVGIENGQRFSLNYVGEVSSNLVY